MNATTELWAYRGLIYNLAQRELRSRYRRSLLGWLWSLLNPASTLLIYTLVFGTFLKIVPPPAGNPDASYFALYLFSALVVWNFFNATVNGSIGALQGLGSLLNKVYFPPESPALASIATNLVQTFIEAGILALVMLALGNLHWTVLLFPLLVILLAGISLGFGLVVSVYNVLYRDVGYLVGILLNVLFYLTPIAYPLTLVPEDLHGIPLRDLIELNPLTRFVEANRDLFYFGRVPPWQTIVFLVVVSPIVFVVGWRIFVHKARSVVEEL